MFTSNRVYSALLIIAVQAYSLSGLQNSEARDLTDVLIRGFTFQAFNRDTAAPAREVAPAFAAAVAQAVTQEVPLAAVAPAFTYRYNPSLSIFERSTSVPGPLFSERALTLGKGQLNFGVGYSFIDFTELIGGIVPLNHDGFRAEFTPSGGIEYTF